MQPYIYKVQDHKKKLGRPDISNIRVQIDWASGKVGGDD